MANKMIDRPVFLNQDGTYLYSIKIPEFMREHANYDHWEKDRVLSMAENLKPGDVLIDIGAEMGWMSAIFAKIVGPENLCLIESAADLWPTIKEIWDANEFATPLASYCGFASRKSNGGTVVSNSWPEQANEKPMIDFSEWGRIHTDTPGKQISIDDFVFKSGISPRALTIDIEGGEAWIEEMAELTIQHFRPLVWISLHPDDRLSKYGKTKQDVRDFFKRQDYLEQYLGCDHEEHSFFFPSEQANKVVLVDSPWGSSAKRHQYFEEVHPTWKDTMPARGQYWMHE